MNKATEQRVKDKLKQLSNTLNTPFNLLLDTLFLERFLVRIARSNYKDKLIFKGGMCLAQFIEIGRETKDIDFLLTQIEGSIETVKQIMEEIIAVDFGVGDVVRPRMLHVEMVGHNASLFEDSIALNAYPPEYIFSEKLEAILYLGELNSRMKDFYDCYKLIQRNVLDAAVLKVAIAETMENRGTVLSLIPEDIDVFDMRWKAFIRKNRLDDLNLNEVVTEINGVIIQIL